MKKELVFYEDKSLEEIRNIKYLISDESIEDFTSNLYLLLDKYRFTLETISILSTMEINTIENFINKKDGLTYEEISIIEDCVILPLLKAVDVCEHNLRMKILAKESNRNVNNEINYLD